MDGLGKIAMAAYVLVGAMVLVSILAFVNHARLTRRNVLPEEQRLNLQAQLLDAVKEASFNKGIEVDLSGFWRGSGVKASQRNAVINPLVKQRHIYLPPEPDRRSGSDSVMDGLMEMFGEWARTVWEYGLARPPKRVILSERTWELMVRGANGFSIVVGSVQTMSFQSQDSGGGDIIGSPQAGRNVNYTAGDVNRSVGQVGVSGVDLADLVQALRADARGLPSGEDKQRVRELAEKIEDEDSLDEPDEDKVEGMIARASRYVGDLGGAMASTGRLLEAWQGFKGQL